MPQGKKLTELPKLTITANNDILLIGDVSEAGAAKTIELGQLVKPATATSAGVIQLAGDLQGSSTNPTIRDKASGQQLTSHVNDLDNPHNVTATQIGKDIAQWNADRINNLSLALGTSPNDEAVLTWDASLETIVFRTNPQISEATTTTKGIITLSGDLSGSANNPTVPGLAAKANLVSPAFTGTPTAPTQASTDNSTRLATTAFVITAITNSGGGGNGITPAGVAYLDLSQQFTKTQGNTTVSLTDAASIIVDGSLSNKFLVTLGGSRTLSNPTNLKDATYIFTIRQDATGSRKLDYDTLYRFPDGVKPTLSTTPNTEDELYCNSNGDYLKCVLNKNFKQIVIVLTYSSDGDANGLLYWLGTNKGATTTFSNPQSIGTATITASSAGSFANLLVISDRAPGRYATNSAANSFIKVEINGSNKLTCNYYSIRTWDDSPFHIRSWVLEGSTDDSNWTLLNTQTNNETLNASNAWVSLPVTSTIAYKYFRIIMTSPNNGGSNEFLVGEIELYGTIS